MPRKVGIVGAGHVGIMTASYLLDHNICDNIFIYDKNLEKAQAEALDLIDTLSFVQSYVRVFATDDPQVLAETHIIINALGSVHSVIEDEENHLLANAASIKEIYPQIVEAGFEGIIINVSSPNEALTMLIQEVSGLPRERVFGIGTYIDTLRLYRIMSFALQIHPRDFEGFVLGAHVSSPFIAWSSVRINGYSVAEVEDPDNFDKESIVDSLCSTRQELIRGKKHDSTAVSKIASQLVDYIFSGSNRIIPLAVYHEPSETYISTPVVLSKMGVRKVLPLFVTDDEMERFNTSASEIKSLYEKIAPNKK